MKHGFRRNVDGTQPQSWVGRLLRDSAIVITALSLMSYYSAYKYEMAYCAYFHVGHDIVVVTFSHMVHYVQWLVTILLGSTVGLWLIALILPESVMELPASVRLRWCSLAILCAVSLFASQWWWAGLSLWVFVVYDIIHPMRRHRRSGWLQAVIAADRFDESIERGTLAARIPMLSGYIVPTLICVAVIGSMLAGAGLRDAQRATMFLVTQKDGETYAVVGAYGGLMYGASFKDKQLTGTVRAFEPTTSFKAEVVGPLKQWKP